MTTDRPLYGRKTGIYQSPSATKPDVLELKLPLKPQYLQIARAAAGMIAGGMDFNYDEIIQVRVAVAEAFELTRLRTHRGNPGEETADVLIQFTVAANRLEILLPCLGKCRQEEGRQEENRKEASGTGNIWAQAASPEESESAALLQSLMDTVELQGEASGNSAIRLIKYRTAIES